MNGTATDMVASALPLILISAWNDSGGGYTHRLFDGHDGINVWPFELQLGTDHVADGFSDWFHKKYRWPVFAEPIERMTAEVLFDAILDEELKQNLTLKGKDKFSDFPVSLSIEDWKRGFACHLRDLVSASRANVLEAYLSSFFSIWKGERWTDFLEKPCLGHCPNIVLDFDQILRDFPNMKMIHLVRSPFSGLYDIRQRRPEIPTETFCRKWNLINQVAFYYAGKYPGTLKMVFLEDLLGDLESTIHSMCAWLNIPFQTSLLQPTWNGAKLAEIQPFGGVVDVRQAYEEMAKASLSAEDRDVVTMLTAAYRAQLNHPSM